MMNVDTRVFRRTKDRNSPVGDWFAELIKEEPWFRDLLPNVRAIV